MLGGAQTLHVILCALPGLHCYDSCGGPCCICSLVWMLWGNGPFVKKIFLHLFQKFLHGPDGLEKKEFQVLLVLSWYMACFLCGV